MPRWPLLLLLVVAAGFALAGCGGAGEPSARLVPPSEFAAATADPAVVTINVHVPDEGSIAGTELMIPYDGIAAARGKLPPQGTPLAVYCMSGRMSALAVRTLTELGYESIVELRGGMVAWQATGRLLLPPGS